MEAKMIVCEVCGMELQNNEILRTASIRTKIETKHN